MRKGLFLLLAAFIVLLALTYISVGGNPREFGTSVIEDIGNVDTADFRNYDSVLVAANDLYEGGKIKELMQGSNYRQAWSTSIKVPVVFLDTLKGGLKILEEGGGKQTHSLKLKSRDGVVYTLRSVTKDPKKLVPDIARTLGLENIIIDGISAQHPYGAILAAKLAEAVNVLHTHPQVVFLPKQEKLGKFNEKYGNRLFLLEYETESKQNWTNINNVEEIIETDDLQELKQKYGSNLSIDHEMLIRTRLFDFLIGDWDRHSEQWGWIIQKNGMDWKAIPIPGDRDNAFFNPDGVIPSIITSQHIKPLIRPYEKDIDHMQGLVYPFDIYFLKGTSEEIYIQQARELQRLLTDKKIKEAFRGWPEAIRTLNENEITEKLKSRREHLVEHAKSFHSIIEKSQYLDEPLKGSEDLNLRKGLLQCFECK